MGVSERPIIFSAPMVRAILAGRKTMTRRLATSPLRKCEPGDMLWVRESFKLADSGMDPRGEHLIYNADGAHGYAVSSSRFVKVKMKSISSIHMPRWASRITLEVTGARVERLQDISEEDVAAEGVDPYCMTARGAFFALWNSLHGPASWEANPSVVCVSFKRIPR